MVTNFIAFVIVSVLLALFALFVSIYKRKSVGGVDVAFNHIYTDRSLKQIISVSANSDRYNLPFICEGDIITKINRGIKIISSNGVIYKKDNDYDCKPKW